MSREDIFAMINDERDRQEQLWGIEFDNAHTMNDWVTYICRYASSSAKMGEGVEHFKAQILKTATICVAALEAAERLGELPPRHYDDMPVPANLTA